jgi:hypothetical protein
MIEAKAYVNDRNQAVISCSQCGKRKTLEIPDTLLVRDRVRVRCACSHSFTVEVERRKHYRKDVHLRGQYRREKPAADAGEMVVEDVSHGGIAFRVLSQHQLQVGDFLCLQFTLDDARKSVVMRNVTVRWVDRSCIGAAFCDPAFNKDLAFYLMP